MALKTVLHFYTVNIPKRNLYLFIYIIAVYNPYCKYTKIHLGMYLPVCVYFTF